MQIVQHFSWISVLGCSVADFYLLIYLTETYVGKR